MKILSRLPSPSFFFLLTLAAFLWFFASPAKADSTGFLSLINSYRQQNGIDALVEDQNLTNAACWFAAEMGSKNYFPSDHIDSLGRTMGQRLTDFGIGGSKAENIFYTTEGSAASYAFNSWKKSSGHNTNMLNGTYTRIGIGRVNAGSKWYWVTDFANGSAFVLNNQCGVSTAPSPTPPPPPPAPVKKDAPPPPIVAEAVQVETPQAPEIPTVPEIATTEAKLATNSATKSPKIVKINEGAKNEDKATLVKGVAATTIVLGNLALFAFIIFNLYKHHKFLKN